jgi:hypothetical protein
MDYETYMRAVDAAKQDLTEMGFTFVDFEPNQVKVHNQKQEWTATFYALTSAYYRYREKFTPQTLVDKIVNDFTKRYANRDVDLTRAPSVWLRVPANKVHEIEAFIHYGTPMGKEGRASNAI